MPGEAELLRRIGEGDHEAFSELYDAYSRLVYSAALRILRDPGEAEAAAQKVFTGVWKKPGAYDHRKARLSTWLMIITRNVAIDRLREQQSRNRLESAGCSLSTVIADSEGENPLSGLLRDERRARIMEALSGIPEKQRAAIYLNFYDGLSHSQIAALIDEPLGTVKTRIQLGLGKLRAALETDFSDEQG